MVNSYKIFVSENKQMIYHLFTDFKVIAACVFKVDERSSYEEIKKRIRKKYPKFFFDPFKISQKRIHKQKLMFCSCSNIEKVTA